MKIIIKILCPFFLLAIFSSSYAASIKEVSPCGTQEGSTASTTLQNTAEWASSFKVYVSCEKGQDKNKVDMKIGSLTSGGSLVIKGLENIKAIKVKKVGGTDKNAAVINQPYSHISNTTCKVVFNAANLTSKQKHSGVIVNCQNGYHVYRNNTSKQN